MIDWGDIVKLIHSMFITFVIFAPFINDCHCLVSHAIIIPFLFGHWITNNDTCLLTEMEKAFTSKTQNDQTFIGSIVGPVYNLESVDVKVVSFALWCITILSIRRNEIDLRKELVKSFK